MRTQTEINRASIEKHLKDAWEVAIHAYGSEAPIVKAIEKAALKLWMEEERE